MVLKFGKMRFSSIKIIIIIILLLLLLIRKFSIIIISFIGVGIKYISPFRITRELLNLILVIVVIIISIIITSSTTIIVLRVFLIDRAQ